MLMVLLMVAILGVLVLGIIQHGSLETDAAGAKRRYDKAVTCTDLARNYLMSQFHAVGLGSGSVGIPVTLNPVTVNDQLMYGGHYNTFVPDGGIERVSGIGGSNLGMTDISNRISAAGLGGQFYRFTVVCTNAAMGIDAGSRESEVEFLVNFGL
jgi:hypothetical protein